MGLNWQHYLCNVKNNYAFAISFYFLLDIQLYFRLRIIAVLASKKLWQSFCETFLKISFFDSLPSFVKFIVLLRDNISLAAQA